MDQLIPLTDNKLKTIFDKEIINLFGENNTMGIMEAVREQILDEGFEKGEAKGIALGREKGKAEGALRIAHELKKVKLPIEQISKITRLSVKEIEALV